MRMSCAWCLSEMPRWRFKRPGLCIGRAMVLSCILLASSPAYSAAPDDADLEALSTADKVTALPGHASDWKVLLEGAVGNAWQRYGLPTVDTERLSSAVALDKTLLPGWRLLLDDRLDWNWQGQNPSATRFNTLKEFYLSWQITPGELADFGRINTHYGSATGYNPTDFFRGNAIRALVSLDPNSVRDNRLGSVMLRSQILWTGGSLTALVSPRLAGAPGTAPYSLDAGATNNMNRWLLALSGQVSENINPQFLLYGEAGKSPQLGFNLSYLLNDATTATLEWSGGNSATLYAQSLGNSQKEGFLSRLATGLTYTTSNNISLTVEAEFNGTAVDSAAWTALGHGPLAAYLHYLSFAAQARDLPTRESLFLMTRWPDALLRHLDLTAFVRQDRVDQSRLDWVEARYHWEHVDMALQGQRYGGRAMSEFGVLPQRTILQTVMSYYF